MIDVFVCEKCGFGVVLCVFVEGLRERCDRSAFVSRVVRDEFVILFVWVGEFFFVFYEVFV